MIALSPSILTSLHTAAHHPHWHAWVNQLPEQWANWQQTSQYSLFQQGYRWIQQLPQLQPLQSELQQEITINGHPTTESGDDHTSWQIQLQKVLEQLKPWRKGPFNLYGITLDSEWRCDWKWQRLLPHITPLDGRLILDVGCANGYYLWRMIGAGAQYALGIDPMGRFFAQFTALRQLIGTQYPLSMLPLTLDQLPPLAIFDSVFSMGVLYHHRHPLQHLRQLKQQLRPGGELILESLILPDDYPIPLLIPTKRYAQMRNVYAIPTALTLLNWLTQSGFDNPQLVNIHRTTPAEQRCTHWSGLQSLANFLDPNNPLKTVEGYPAPLRAIIVAKRSA